MKHYELNCLISSNLSQEELKTIQEKIQNSIQEEGGVLTGAKNPIKTRFHSKTEMAYLFSLDFNLPPEKTKIIDKKLKSEGQILRYLIMNKKKEEIISPKTKVAYKPGTEEIKKEKVKLEEIEEKLEEILGKS